MEYLSWFSRNVSVADLGTRIGAMGALQARQRAVVLGLTGYCMAAVSLALNLGEEVLSSVKARVRELIGALWL